MSTAFFFNFCFDHKHFRSFFSEPILISFCSELKHFRSFLSEPILFSFCFDLKHFRSFLSEPILISFCMKRNSIHSLFVLSFARCHCSLERNFLLKTQMSFSPMRKQKKSFIMVVIVISPSVMTPHYEFNFGNFHSSSLSWKSRAVKYLS
jgi:hypothetical protein